MTYFWPEGEAIIVAANPLATPLHFVWREELHPVAGIIARWRLDEDWWKKRIWREYFKLYTTTGLFVIIYHDLLSGKWCLQHLFD